MPKNTTRKTTKQVTQTPMANAGAAAAAAAEDDWGFSALVVKSTAATTRSKKRVFERRPEPVPEWDQVGMTEEAYKTLCQRTAAQRRMWQIENIQQAMLADLDSTDYWERRIESLETTRERYNTRGGWSAEHVAAVMEIDAEIKQCEEEIARIEDYDDYENEPNEQIGVF